MKKQYYLGINTGTSQDAIDAVIVDLGESIHLVATYSEPIPTNLQNQLRALQQTEHQSLKLLGTLDTELGKLFATTCQQLLAKAKLSAEDIIAIGSHGQTVYHQPAAPHPFTLQIGDPNIIAATTSITTVADFRRRDLALGGQGAPLAPALHQALFGSPLQNRCLVNLGGIANLSYLSKASNTPILGFDTGPANILLDSWCRTKQQLPFDPAGAWASQGSVIDDLLFTCLEEDFFKLPPPKSTGPELFNLSWLGAKLKKRYLAVDVQRTLLELTAQSITQAIDTHCPDTEGIWLCGGGVHNLALTERITQLANAPVQSTQALGIDPDYLEAILFAWLAQQTLAGLAGNVPSVTGASSASVIGAIYPSNRATRKMP